MYLLKSGVNKLTCIKKTIIRPINCPNKATLPEAPNNLINKTDKSAISKRNKCLDHHKKWRMQSYFN